MTGAEHPVDADTAVEPSGDGRFSAAISHRWNRLLGGFLGGYLEHRITMLVHLLDG